MKWQNSSLTQSELSLPKYRVPNLKILCIEKLPQLDGPVCLQVICHKYFNFAKEKGWKIIFFFFLDHIEICFGVLS